MTCGNCHTPKGPPAAVAGKEFSGGLRWDEPPFKVTAPNITPGQGNRHRQLDRRSDQDDAADRQESERRAGGRGDADGVLSDPHARRSRTPSSPICARSSRSRTRCPTRSTRSRCRIMCSRAPRSPTRRPISTTSSSAASISPPSAIAWSATRRSRRAAGRGFRRTRSARAAANSPGPGACRSRATSPRTRPPASATGPTPRSRPRSPRASGRTARRSSGPMGYQYYAKMTDADLDAVIAYLRTRAGEGIARLSAPAPVLPGQGMAGARALQLPRRGAYISVPSTGTRPPCLIA